MMELEQIVTPLIRADNLRELTTLEECKAALDREFAIIFKHSHSCDMSQVAYQTVTRFCSKEPARTIFLISVPKFRDVADFVEKQTGVRHESPQILAISHGMVFAHASHGRISASLLATLYSE